MAANIQDVANKTFDYVIVGGGTAGLTLAARLSEDPSKSVLVLEAGEAHLSNKDILAVQAYGSHFANSAYAYRHKWITQKHAADREGVWERGKGLGGSSGINFLAWFRPPAKDIDDLGKLGNPGWTFANYLPRVTRVEGLTEPSKEIAERNYIDTKNWTVGRDGPVQVSVPKNVSEGESRIMDTFHKAGFPKNSEPYNGDPTGYFILLTSRDPKTNTRSYAATAYYEPNVHRTNFTVLVTASARRVLLSSIEGRDELKATGVEFEHGGHVHEVYAKNEVILTAGTLSSPHLLELSGIGRRDVLSKIGVPLKVELPGVGENLQEHIYVAFSFKLKEDAPMQTLDILRDPAVLADHIQLEKEGKGLFHEGVIGNGQLSLADTSPRAPELYTRITQILTALQDEVAEMEKNSADKGDVEVKKGLVEQYKLLVQRYHPKHGEGSPSFQWISFPAFFSGPNVPEPGKQYTSPMMVLNHTFSRGTIHSVSNDPSVSPEIDPRYFSQDIDLELMYEQFLRTREVVKLSPFKDMIEGEINPGPNVTSKEDIKDWIKKTFATIYHTVGSCSMLPRDKGGVVSPELKVYGTTNLRVADISIVPLHIGANTQSTAYALGEIAADIINGKWITA